MVTRNDNGDYVISGITLSSYDASQIYMFIKREYDTEDLAGVVENEYDTQTAEEVVTKKELWNAMIDTFEDVKSNNDQWLYDAEFVVSEFRSEIDVIAANH